MDGNGLASDEGFWHEAVRLELVKLKSQGILDQKILNQKAVGFLQTLPYEEALMVLENIRNKQSGENISKWIIKECKEMRQKFGTVKEKEDYAAAELLVKCSEKAANASKKKSLKASELKQKASGGAASKAKQKASGGAAFKKKAAKASELKQKASGGAASKKKAAKASGGAAPERPSERFLYKRTPDGSRTKVFKPTTQDNPVVISD
jgi:hypothetical protein